MHHTLLPPHGKPVWKELEKYVRRSGYSGEVILYNGSRFQLLETKIHTLSTCIVTEVKLQPLDIKHQPIESPFIVMNTHLDSEDDYRAISMKEIRDQVLPKITREIPALLAGDFNTNPEPGYFGDFSDSISPGPTIGGRKHPETFIDHIFVNSVVQVKKNKILMELAANETKKMQITPEGVEVNRALTSLSDHAQLVIDFITP